MRIPRKFFSKAVLCLVVSAAPVALAQSDFQTRFTSFQEAQPALQGIPAAGTSEAAAARTVTAATWPDWVQKHDREIRLRLVRGEEDTLTNFLRFGLNFSKQPAISNRQLVDYDKDAKVRETAAKRIDDLMAAMARPGENERIAHMRSFVETEGFSLQSPEAVSKLKAYLLANLLRMRDEFVQYLNQPQGANPFEIFKDRGISLDTNLWPDFLIDVHLRHMMEAGLLKPGSVKRVAIVGPGLDFTNKEDGSDYYPPQTNQPFAVLDSLFRLGLADPKTVELYTLDISPEVTEHVRHARQQAMVGVPYVLQLPWKAAAPLSPEYRGHFIQYWQALGSSLGETVEPIVVPGAIAAATQIKAVKIRPEIVRRIQAVNLDVVCQRLEIPADQKFDLVIGTNVFLYYGAFDQMLLRSNIALMLKPGGFLLSNDKLPDTAPQLLENSLVTSQVVGQAPEFMFSYRLR
jgi:hypothetical protein